MCYKHLHNLFNFNFCHLNLVIPDNDLNWVWLPDSNSDKISSAVFSFFNGRDMSDFIKWNGWANLWKLNVARWSKYFMWLVIHGRVKRLKTYKFLHSLSLGPEALCALCGLERKNIECFFKSCYKSQQVWHKVELITGFHPRWCEGIIATGSWLGNTQSKRAFSDHSTVWKI